HRRTVAWLAAGRRWCAVLADPHRCRRPAPQAYSSAAYCGEPALDEEHSYTMVSASRQAALYIVRWCARIAHIPRAPRGKADLMVTQRWSSVRERGSGIE